MAMNFVTFNQDYSCLAVGKFIISPSLYLLLIPLHRNVQRLPDLPY